MPSRRRSRQFGEPAHAGRIYIGRCIAVGEDKCAERVTRARVQELVAAIGRNAGGGATATPARGVWRVPAVREGGKVKSPARVEKEPSVAIDVVSAGSDSCERFQTVLRKSAALAARAAKQSAVLAVAHCADGKVDAKLVDRKGGIAYLLSPTRSALGGLVPRRRRRS